MKQPTEKRSHRENDYFALVRRALADGDREALAAAYELIDAEIREETLPPARPVKFGTSGWRGILGKEMNCHSVARVTKAICDIYSDPRTISRLADLLLVENPEEARERGCLIGHDNRFGGETMARTVAEVLSGEGFRVHYAGEATTGVLSAALLELGAAFSINLTPSHNPLEYGGFKFNAADGGPAQPVLTSLITEKAREMLAREEIDCAPPRPELVRPVDALALWRDFVRNNSAVHHLDPDDIMARLAAREDMVVAVDSVHGASRIHMEELFGPAAKRMVHLRSGTDVTFGGVAPEPSSANMQPVMELLAARKEPLKLGVIIDPDADRIRFTDGIREIDMNFFGAMAFHFLHREMGLSGLAAKNVGTSNLVNRIARALGEEAVETRVGFKEFRPYLGRALVFFEESDGISILGHTPEKDAYIGLLLALEMMLRRNENLSAYLAAIEDEYGRAYPGRGSVPVTAAGDRLREALSRLNEKGPGERIKVGGKEREIARLITVDGHKMVFADSSWILIRPSGTEPKVRFYVEGNSARDRDELMAAAAALLKDLGLI